MTDPEWWIRARKLEAAGQLEAAERAIIDSVPHLGAYSSVAQLYLERMLRLQAAGDTEGAQAAYHKSCDWIWSYAGLATSGGEGAALSLERDEFLRELDTLWTGEKATD